MTGLRGLLWRVLAVLSWLLLPLALTSGWLAAVVTDTDSYVDTVGPLASDETVQREVAERLEGRLVEAVDSTGATLEGRSRELVATTVDDAVESEQFERLWRSANREMHRQTVRVLEGDSDRLVESNGRVSMDLGPVYSSVVRQLEQQGVQGAAAAPRVEVTVPLAAANELDRLRAAYQLLDAAGFWLPVAWLVLVVATLLIAPQRSRAARWLAWGSIAGVLLLVLALALARATVVSELGSSGDEELVRAIWDVLVSRLYYAVVALLVVAVAVLVITAVLGRRASRRRYVSEAQPA